MSNDSSSPLSDETIGYLEEVKKGKPRKFAMICKGQSVVSLVVYKKGNVEKRRKEAKEQGKGQFYFGVVDGKGIDIRFVLARADGFESAPVKSTILKSFLADAELKFKPYFEIVDSAPLVLNDEDPLVARFVALQSAALKACDAQPNRAQEINDLCLKIGKSLDQELSDQALVDIEALEALLKSLGVDAAASSSTAGQTATDKSAAAGDTTARDKVRALLSKLTPLLTQAITLQPQQQALLTSAFTEAERLLENGSVEAAQTAAVALAKQLKDIISLGVAGGSASVTSNEAAEFDRRKVQVEQELLGAQKALPDKSLALSNVWQHAMTQADKGNYPLANKALDKLQEAIRGLLSASQDKWQGWQAARERVVQQIKQVATAVAATKDPDARNVIVELQAITKNLTLKPEGQAIAELRRFLLDDVITAAEEVPAKFGALQIRQPLLNALQALEV